MVERITLDTTSERKSKSHASLIEIESGTASLDRNNCEDWKLPQLRALATKRNVLGRSKLTTKAQLCRRLNISFRPRPCLPKSGRHNNAWSMSELRALATKRKIAGRSKLKTKAQLCVRIMGMNLPSSWLHQQVELHVHEIIAKAQRIWDRIPERDPLRCLKGQRLLTDEVINGYGYGNFTPGLINRSQLRSKKIQNRCFALSTLSIFTKNRNGQMLKKAEIMERYNRVKKTTGKFSYIPTLEQIRPRYLLIPCHQGGNHWTLYAIDMKAHMVRFYDSLAMGPSGGHVRVVKDHASVLYERLYPNKQSPTWEYRAEKIENQGNGVDCGVHVCVLMRIISLGLIDNISDSLYASSETPFYRAMITYELAHKKLIPIG